jgi:hypothetical protein
VPLFAGTGPAAATLRCRVKVGIQKSSAGVQGLSHLSGWEQALRGSFFCGLRSSEPIAGKPLSRLAT